MPAFPTSRPSDLARRTEDLAFHLMERSDQFYEYLIKEYKDFWDPFWNPLLPVEDMQALVDYYFDTQTTDLGQPINAMDAFFNSAERGIMFLMREHPEDFQDGIPDTDERNATKEWRGLMLPDFPSVQYQRYVTAGWVYEIQKVNGVDRMVMIEPCQWKDPAPPPAQ